MTLYHQYLDEEGNILPEKPDSLLDVVEYVIIIPAYGMLLHNKDTDKYTSSFVRVYAGLERQWEEVPDNFN